LKKKEKKGHTEEQILTSGFASSLLSGCGLSLSHFSVEGKKKSV
jgi:hypothetical protein